VHPVGMNGRSPVLLRRRAMALLSRLLVLAFTIPMAISVGSIGPAWGHDGPHDRRGKPQVRIDPAVTYPARLIAAGGGHFHAILVDTSAGWLLAGTHLGLFRSVDSGLTWRLAASRFSGKDVHALVRDPVTGVIRAATHGQGLVMSGDEGRTWKDDSSGLPTLDLHALALDPHRPDHVYVWAVGHGLLHRTSAAPRWERLAPANALGDVRALGVHPKDSQRLYAATDRGIWLSADGGRHWEQPADGLRTPAAGIALVRASSDVLLAATDSGVFVGDPSASRWRPAGSSPTWWGPLVAFTSSAAGTDIIALSHEGIVAARRFDGTEWTPLAHTPAARQTNHRE
jgi:photosystem II stability/assembly factor-like uncharacterized protein